MISLILFISLNCTDSIPLKDTTVSYTCRLTMPPVSTKEIKRLRKIGERANRRYRRYRRHGKG